MCTKCISKKSTVKIKSTSIILIAKANKLETRNILIEEKNWRISQYILHVHRRLIKMLSLHYHKLVGKIKEHEGKKHLMVNDHMLDKMLEN